LQTPPDHPSFIDLTNHITKSFLRVCRIKTPHRKPKKLPKNAENRQEMWAAMTRSLEMIRMIFEYYSVSVVADSAQEESSPTHENRYQLLVNFCIPQAERTKKNCTQTFCIFKTIFDESL
jgi:hypothetical protein